MKEKSYVINRYEDLEKLNYIDDDIKRVILIFTNDIDFKGIYFSPINLKHTDVYIYGNFKKLDNINIDCNYMDCALFKCANTIYVKNLIFRNASIKSTDSIAALIVANAKNVIIDCCSIEAKVEAESHVGTIAGSADNVEIKDTVIEATLTAKDFVGGVVGITRTPIIENNNKYNIDIKSNGRSKNKIYGFKG